MAQIVETPAQNEWRRGVLLQRPWTSSRVANPEVIVLDIDLPDGDGRDVIAALRRDPLTANVPVLMISGNVDHYRRMQALEAGAADLLEKPFDSVMLERRLNWMVIKARAANA